MLAEYPSEGLKLYAPRGELGSIIRPAKFAHHETSVAFGAGRRVDPITLNEAVERK